eukprot:9118145-Pyramimonas_sp.AAC.1
MATPDQHLFTSRAAMRRSTSSSTSDCFASDTADLAVRGFAPGVLGTPRPPSPVKTVREQAIAVGFSIGPAETATAPPSCDPAAAWAPLGLPNWLESCSSASWRATLSSSCAFL